MPPERARGDKEFIVQQCGRPDAVPIMPSHDASAEGMGREGKKWDKIPQGERGRWEGWGRESVSDWGDKGKGFGWCRAKLAGQQNVDRSRRGAGVKSKEHGNRESGGGEYGGDRFAAVAGAHDLEAEGADRGGQRGAGGGGAGGDRAAAAGVPGFGGILVDSQKIPDRYVATTVSNDANERLASITQQILSGERLQSIMDEFHLYAGTGKGRSTEDRLEAMRKHVKIEIDKNSAVRHLNAFQVMYEGRDRRWWRR